MLMISANFSLILAEYSSMNVSKIGIFYVPYGIGTVLGALFGGKFADIFKKKFGIGGLVIMHVIYALITTISVFIFGWIVIYSPITSSIMAMFASFGAISSRSTVMSISVLLNADSTASATAALICFQFFLSIPELLITGVLLSRVTPGIIFSLWAGCIIISMPFSIIIALKYWNTKTFDTININKI